MGLKMKGALQVASGVLHLRTQRSNALVVVPNTLPAPAALAQGSSTDTAPCASGLARSTPTVGASHPLAGKVKVSRGAVPCRAATREAEGRASDVTCRSEKGGPV